VPWRLHNPKAAVFEVVRRSVERTPGFPRAANLFKWITLRARVVAEKSTIPLNSLQYLPVLDMPWTTVFSRARSKQYLCIREFSLCWTTVIPVCVAVNPAKRGLKSALAQLTTQGLLAIPEHNRVNLPSLHPQHLQLIHQRMSRSHWLGSRESILENPRCVEAAVLHQCQPYESQSMPELQQTSLMPRSQSILRPVALWWI
jgi:hypothetical protein